MLMTNHGKNTGFILLIVGAIIAGILALLGLVLGIITHGFSAGIVAVQKAAGRATFESNLDFGAVASLRSLYPVVILLRLHLCTEGRGCTSWTENWSCTCRVDYEGRSETIALQCWNIIISLNAILLELKKVFAKRDMKNIETKFYSKEKLEKSIKRSLIAYIYFAANTYSALSYPRNIDIKPTS